jgi:hypothetical protein
MSPIHPSSRRNAALSRREAVKRLAQISLTVAAAGCTPLRYALHLYPDGLDGTDAGDRVLAAFARTVIPGAPPEDASIFRPLTDPELPFRRYAAFFAADLNRRARAAFGRDFERSTLAQRTEVIRRALAATGTTGQLYGGAVYVVQIAYYAGIYDDARGCPLIGFDGAYRFRGLEATSFSNPERYLARHVSPDGNPA